MMGKPGWVRHRATDGIKITCQTQCTWGNSVLSDSDMLTQVRLTLYFTQVAHRGPYVFSYLFFLFLICLFVCMFIYQREKKGGRKRSRETSIGCLSYVPLQGTKPTTQAMCPEWEEPATSCFAGQHPINWATLVGARLQSFCWQRWYHCSCLWTVAGIGGDLRFDDESGLNTSKT